MTTRIVKIVRTTTVTLSGKTVTTETTTVHEGDAEDIDSISRELDDALEGAGRMLDGMFNGIFEGIGHALSESIRSAFDFGGSAPTPPTPPRPPRATRPARPREPGAVADVIPILRKPAG